MGQLLEWVEEQGVFLALAAPGRELDLSDPRDRLNASFISMMDEYYAADIARRMRDSVAHRRQQGQTVGPAPSARSAMMTGISVPAHSVRGGYRVATM